MDPNRTATARAELASNPRGVLFSTAFEHGCKISRHGDTVTKSGTKVHREEGHALTFAATLSLPVPKVHGITATQDGTSIRMDYIDGSCLEDVWVDTCNDQKYSIAQQLRHIKSTMRAHQCPTSTLIGACNGPARDCRYISGYTGGPFENETQFNDFVLTLGKRTPALIRQTLAESLDQQSGHRIVFTHADLSPRNIIIRHGQIIGLLDWEFAGWYPEHWEYIKFFDRPTACIGWLDLAKDIFETLYSQELLTHQAIARWQRP